MRYLVTMTVDIEEIKDRKRKEPNKGVGDLNEEAIPQPAKSRSSPMTYSVKEVGKLLGISRSSVYVLLNAGLLTPIRIGRRVLFTENELRSFIDKRSKINL